MSVAPDRQRALRVAVLVTLERGPGAGGHVKCWERFGEAAAEIPDAVDLTLHFLGPEEHTERAAANLRIAEHPARLGTRRFRFLDAGAGHTDLARSHPALARALAGVDVVHATDFFSFGRTALRMARPTGCGLAASIHTDVPLFTRIYAAEIFRSLLGPVGAHLNQTWRLPERIARRIERGIDHNLMRCDRVLVSKPQDRARLEALVPGGRVSVLRRGIDRARFSPMHRDRAWLSAQHGIPAERPVLMFAGRADASKNVMVAAKAVARLIGQGYDLQFLAAGSGSALDAIRALLGARATLPGNVPQLLLARYLASADLFLFPSTTEVSPNVVLEAKASGLPVLVASAHGGGQFIARNGADGFVLDTTDPSDWAEAARPLLLDADRRAAIGAAARQWAERDWPSWREVLEQDLLPAWTSAAAVAHARRAAAPTI
jgi:glycosyltransferase involved in cell wall biosynthesis